jgi:hypothetical protein
MLYFINARNSDPDYNALLKRSAREKILATFANPTAKLG